MDYKTYIIKYKTAPGRILTKEIEGRDKGEARKNFSKLFSIQNIIAVTEKANQ